MTSIEYAELAGLNICLRNLECVPLEEQDEEWLTVVDFIRKRNSHLSSKK